MSYNYNRSGSLVSYYIMYQDANSSATAPRYNASFADLIKLGINSRQADNYNGFNGTMQEFCEALVTGANANGLADDAQVWTPTGFMTLANIFGAKNIFQNNTPNTFWNGSNFSVIPIADASTNGGITNTTFVDWNTRLAGTMGSYTNGSAGSYTNYVDWITDVYNVANGALTNADTALTNADAAAGIATCADSNATAALSAIGNVSNIEQPYTNIVDWTSHISSIATNANSNATNAINAIGNVPSGSNVMEIIGNVPAGNSVMEYVGPVSNIPSPYNNIIDWVNGELGDISSQLTNIIGS